MGWGWDSDYEPKLNTEPELKPAAQPVMEEVRVNVSEKSPIEMLPAELLGKPFPFVINSTNRITGYMFTIRTRLLAQIDSKESTHRIRVMM